MADPTPEPQPTDPPVEPEPSDDLGDAGKKALEQERKARRDADKRAKDATAELEKLRQQTMTDQEKAVAAAKAEGKAEALAALGAAHVEKAFAIAASGRIEPERLHVLMQGLNHSAFLNDDGSVNNDSLTVFIDGIAPKPDPNRRIDLGQGGRPAGTNGPGSGTPADPLEAALTAISRRT